MKNVRSKPLNSFDIWAMRLAQGVSSKFWSPLVNSTGLVLALVAIHYFCSPYAVTRAYVIRSMSFGIGSLMVLAVILLLLAVAYLLALLVLSIGSLKTHRTRTIASVKKRWQAGFFGRVLLWLSIATATLGVLGNLSLTAWGSYHFDSSLKANVAAFEAAHGCFDLHTRRGGTSLVYCPKRDGGFTVRVALNRQVPPQLEQAIAVIEDRGWRDRMFSSSVFGILRAVKSLLSSKGALQGGSSPPEQLAAQILGLNPRREMALRDQLSVKLDKILAGMRISDLYDSDTVLRMYANRVNVVAIAGYEIQGFRASSLLLYGKEPEQLTHAQSFDLVGLLQGPTRRRPYPYRNEEPEAFRVRKDKQLRRLKNSLEDAVHDGEMAQIEADAVISELYATLRPLSSVEADLKIPHRGSLLREIRTRVPDATARFLIVETAADPSAQIMLQEAVAQSREEVESQLQEWERRVLEIDAVVIDETGGFLAEVNGARIEGDGSSIYKGFEYAQALELRILPSIDADVLPGMSAREAIVSSDNSAAEALANKIGPESYKQWLETLGFRVDRATVKNALGAGIDGSPAEVALAFRMFSDRQPGFRVDRSGFVTLIRDAVTGEVLFERRLVQATRVDVASGVRSALEENSLRGTAKRLRDLATTTPVAAKTGTSAFFKDGRWQGAGGSWIAAIDAQTGVTIVVRMRLRGNPGPLPFRPEGGRSAIIVAREFIAAWRERSS